MGCRNLKKKKKNHIKEKQENETFENMMIDMKYWKFIIGSKTRIKTKVQSSC